MGAKSHNREGLDRDPFWYKTGVIYEVHVRAFYDTDANGTGDFRGLTEKLDYIKDLGVTAIWLLPFYPSPLRDDGYDIADYCDVHPMYGTLGDFKTFLREAHRRGLRVITELVLNHTSDQHPWFQRARHARPGSRWREFYVWSDTPTRYKDARIIFKDVEVSNWTWDHAAQAYYWHRFFSHQPDLNYENPEVHQAMTKVVDFWLDMGVDGLRLDAVPYLYEREGTDCENLSETHAFLKRLRQHVDSKYTDRMLLGEANQWPEDAVAYFGQGRGDECHMAFHFPLMPRLFMAVRMEDRQPIVDILEQTPPIPETSQWALFLRNHDELTLEMVTDEERDYMYRMYAHVHQARLNLGIRRRLAPLLGNDRKKIELLNALLFSLPGTPVLYYGDEIGLGENIYLGDRNGVRTPMQWSSDKNAGFSRANPQTLYLPIIVDPVYHYEANNVEAQLANPHSLLWWMRRMLALRKRWRALGEGKCEFLQPDNRRVLSYLLRSGTETLLVVANLSRFAQPVQLDLSPFKGMRPIELFGRMDFPPVTEQPYFLSLGPHSFYWFSLEPKVATESSGTQPPSLRRITLAAGQSWQALLSAKGRGGVEAVLPDYLKRQPWFGGNSRTARLISFRQIIPLTAGETDPMLLSFVQVDYSDGSTELYALPVAFASGPEAEQVRQQNSQLIIAELSAADGQLAGILYDAIAAPGFGQVLLQLVWHRRHLNAGESDLEAFREPKLRRLLGEAVLTAGPITRLDSLNTCLIYGDKLILKLFRRLEPGAHPDLELGHFLTGCEFPHAPRLAGGIQCLDSERTPTALAVLHEFIPNAKEAHAFTVDALGRYFDRVITWVAQGQVAPVTANEPLHLLQQEIAPPIAESIGTYLESARLLGVRTAELHLALVSAPEDGRLAPEPVTPFYLRSVFQSMRNLAAETFRCLRNALRLLSPELASLAQRVLDLQPALIQRYRQFSSRRFAAKRIRIHGDCQLRHILWTGKDFVFIHFEGDCNQALSERCIKRMPVQDVASMLRSFHYAAYAGLYEHVERGSIPHDNIARFEEWVRFWNRWVSLAFVKGYLPLVAPSGLVPANESELREILEVYLLNQLMAELGRELVRPSPSLRIPLQGVLLVLSQGGAEAAPSQPANVAPQ